MRAFAAIAVLGLAAVSAQPAAAGLIGDTVSFGGQSAIISADTTEFTSTYFGLPFTADFTNDTLTLIVNHQVNGGFAEFFGIPFTFTFTNTDVTSLVYLSGTLPPPPPPPRNPCDFAGAEFGVCVIDITLPARAVSGTINNPHTITIGMTAFTGTEPEEVVFAIDAVPEPNSLGIFALPLFFLAAAGFGRQRSTRTLRPAR